MRISKWLENSLPKLTGKRPVARAAISEDDLVVCSEILVEMEELFVRHLCDLEIASVQQLRKALEAGNGSFLGLASGPLVWGGVGSISDVDLRCSGVHKESGREDDIKLRLLISRLGRIILKSGVKSGRIESLTEWYEAYDEEP